MRKFFKKLEPRIISYRSCKHFSNEGFRKTLLNKLSKAIFVATEEGFQRFYSIKIDILDKHAPLKKNHAFDYQIPFITKDLSKTIINRSRLHNNFLKNSTNENKILYTKQRNHSVSLLKKSKKQFNLP